MSLRAYLTVMILATLGSALCFGLVLGIINPNETNLLGLALFYVSLFLTIMGLTAILGFITRFVVLKRRLAVNAVIISFRQAFLIAFVIVVILFLLSHHLFSWLNMALLIIGFSTLEFFLISISLSKDE